MAAAVAAILLGACGGNQSALLPAGSEAMDVARLFWVMVAGAGLVWLAVVALALYAARGEAHEASAARRLIVGGGVVFPTVVLGALLVYGLRLIPTLREPGAADGLVIEVSGEQWWWRVRYLDPRRGPAGIVAANEIRLPVGERTTFRLSSPDVIHSFWIHAGYLAFQLRLFRDGHRGGGPYAPLMQVAPAGLGDADIEALSAY